MSVHINEIEVEPRRQEESKQPAAAGGGQDAQSPELANKVATTVALLHSRELRLVAD